MSQAEDFVFINTSQTEVDFVDIKVEISIASQTLYTSACTTDSW